MSEVTVHKTYHLCLCVRGVLDWKKSMRKKLFKDNTTGKYLTDEETKEYLMDCLVEGKEVIPLSAEPCEGFDYKTGCPGHIKNKQS